MHVSKWGNSLAIRLPAAVVTALELKEGDEVEIYVAGTRRLEISRDRTREKALAKLRALGQKMPEGFRFSRDEVYEP
jgi:antitoxin MazE